MPVHLEDLAVDPLLDGLEEGLESVGEAHVVTGDAVPCNHLACVPSGETLPLASLEVVHEAVHHADQEHRARVEAIGVVVLPSPDE